jgi:hypothetical protein
MRKNGRMEEWKDGRMEGWKGEEWEGEAFDVPGKTLKAALDFEAAVPLAAALPVESFLGGRLGDPALP